MEIFTFHYFMEEINRGIEEQWVNILNNATNCIKNTADFRANLIKEITEIAKKRNYQARFNEDADYPTGERDSVSLTVYENDECILAIEITSSRMKNAIRNLCHINAKYKLMITYYRDQSLCEKLLMEYDRNGEILYIHVPGLQDFPPKEAPIISGIQDLNSPLETLMEDSLKNTGIKYICLYAMYDRLGKKHEVEP